MLFRSFPAVGKMEGNRQAGKAAADDGDIKFHDWGDSVGGVIVIYRDYTPTGGFDCNADRRPKLRLVASVACLLIAVRNSIWIKFLAGQRRCGYLLKYNEPHVEIRVVAVQCVM